MVRNDGGRDPLGLYSSQQSLDPSKRQDVDNNGRILFDTYTEDEERKQQDEALLKA